jgi:antirestriction protein ArdC
MTTYQMVNSIILQKLEEGVIPWKKMWRSETGLPAMSLTTGKMYNGINQIILYCLASQHNTSPYFLTYKQALSRGGHVKPGEKGAPVFFFKRIDEEDTQPGKSTDKSDESASPRFILRYFTVFNLDQCEGISLTETEQQLLSLKEVEMKNHDPVSSAQSILDNYYEMPKVYLKAQYNPSYSPDEDRIFMPLIGQFETAEEYYISFFHELAHSTGHSTRLDRFGGKRTKYQTALEELIGEITAVYLAEESGIRDAIIDNSAGYIDYWKKQITDNSRLFTTATSQAEKAWRYVMDHSWSDQTGKESA